MTYKLREAITGVFGVPQGGMQIITIPASTILHVPDEPHRFGIVEVPWDGHVVGVFMQDLKTRADVVAGTNA